jgi:hypothetical protein
MSTLIGLGVAVALLVVFVVFRSRRDQPADLGQVSSQWLMEHRAMSGQDSSRWNQR